MTVEDLVMKVRVVLRDTGRGQAVLVPKHQDDEILRALNAANKKLALMLIGRSMQGVLPAWITLNKLVTTVAASGNVPANYWTLIGGLRSTDTWIPRMTPAVAQAESGRGHDVIAVIDGAFFGTATTAVYWRKPEEISAAGSGDLTDFSLPYYNTLRLMAAHEIIAREKRNAKRRMIHVENLVKDKSRLLK